jgi:hypothetical protein
MAGMEGSGSAKFERTADHRRHDAARSSSTTCR